MEYKILVINPGSTSTKLSLFLNEKVLFNYDVFHDTEELKRFEHINDQLTYRMKVIDDFIAEKNLDLTNLAAIACRGGASYSVKSGTYEVDEKLIEDTKACKGELYHSSMLGVQMGKLVSQKYGGRLLMSDPTIVDEYLDIARITGIKGIYRKAVSHVLNQKAVGRKYAKDHNLKYEDLNLIIAHIDGGITINAHQKGQMIDGFDGGGGDGPLTPTRMGSMAISDVINYLWDKPESEMKKLISCAGGFANYFHTANADYVHELLTKGDKTATLVWKAMIYQISKCIGAMAVVLKGDVDAIILTGGLCRFDDVVEIIKDNTEWIAQTFVYPGEYEQEALALNALAVLKGEMTAQKYSGQAVFEGI